MVENVYFHHTEIRLQHLLAVGIHSVWRFSACLQWEVFWGGVNTQRCWQFKSPPEVWACTVLLTTQLDLHHHRRQDLVHARVCVFVRATQGGREYAIYQQSEDNFGLSSQRDPQTTLFVFTGCFSPRMPNESEISISFYNNFVSLNERTVGRSFWGNAELPQSCSISPFQPACLRACWLFPSTCMSCSLSSD